MTSTFTKTFLFFLAAFSFVDCAPLTTRDLTGYSEKLLGECTTEVLNGIDWKKFIDDTKETKEPKEPKFDSYSVTADGMRARFGFCVDTSKGIVIGEHLFRDKEILGDTPPYMFDLINQFMEKHSVMELKILAVTDVVKGDMRRTIATFPGDGYHQQHGDGGGYDVIMRSRFGRIATGLGKGSPLWVYLGGVSSAKADMEAAGGSTVVFVYSSSVSLKGLREGVAPRPGGTAGPPAGGPKVQKPKKGMGWADKPAPASGSGSSGPALTGGETGGKTVAKTVAKTVDKKADKKDGKKTCDIC